MYLILKCGKLEENSNLTSTFPAINLQQSVEVDNLFNEIMGHDDKIVYGLLEKVSNL